jgi:hypothetical protein
LTSSHYFALAAVRAGETLSIDWHFAVSEDLLDVSRIRPREHRSVAEADRARAEGSRVGIDACLDKFTEEEKMEDLVCPQCKDSNNVWKRISIWRQPPLLVIQ